MPAGEADKEPAYPLILPWLEKALVLLLAHPDIRLANVNIPTAAHGMQWTRQSCRQYDGKVVPATDPMGRKNFWYTVTPITGAEEGTDRWAVANNYVSITPLRLDLTDDRMLEEGQLRHPLHR
jgi:5'-nucleotidase